MVLTPTRDGSPWTPQSRAAWVNRRRSSRAVSRPKVQSTSSPGGHCPVSSRLTARRATQRVLPAPGPAMTSSGPPAWAITSRCWQSSSGCRRCMAGAISMVVSGFLVLSRVVSECGFQDGAENGRVTGTGTEILPRARRREQPKVARPRRPAVPCPGCLTPAALPRLLYSAGRVRLPSGPGSTRRCWTTSRSTRCMLKVADPTMSRPSRIRSPSSAPRVCCSCRVS